MAVPYTFGSATSSIPLSQLDSNFSTAITLGNTAIQLGNTVTTLNNMTLANVTISSGNVTITSVTLANANITGTTTLSGLTASTALALDASKNIVSVTNTGTGNNVLAASPSLTGTVTIATLNLTNALGTTYGGTGLTSFTANGVVYASSSSALATGSALTFDGSSFAVIGGGSIKANKSSSGQFLSFVAQNSTQNYGIYIDQDNAGSNSWSLFDTTNSQTALRYYPSTSGYWQFYINNSEQMRLTSTGLGIGTSSPDQKLVVQGPSGSAGMKITDGTYSSYIATISSSGNFGNGNAAGQLYLRGQSGIGFTGNGGANTHMTLDSSGRLGINTGSPQTDSQMTIAPSGTNNAQTFVRSSNTANGAIKYITGSTSDWIVGQRNTSDSNLHWYSYNISADAMILDTSGNLGLGVTPSAWTNNKALEVGSVGNGFWGFNASEFNMFQNSYYGSGFKYAGTGLASRYEQNTGNHRWYTAPSGTAGNAITFTQAMTLDSGGTLLIGRTSTPPTAGAKVAIAGSSDSAYQLTKDGVVSARLMAVTTALAFGVDGSDGSTERARIDSSGNLLVGTTTQGYGLFSSSRVTLGNGGSGDGFCVGGLNENLSAYTVQANNNTGIRYFAYIANGSSTPVGTISFTSSGTAYNTSSDYRLKNTIAPMTGALAKVALLKPCTYRWNVDGSEGEGFIAHELAEVVPQCVTGEKDAVDENGNPKYQGIDTSFLVATLTAAIQEQQAIIESLKARLDAANL